MEAWVEIQPLLQRIVLIQFPRLLDFFLMLSLGDYFFKNLSSPQQIRWCVLVRKEAFVGFPVGLFVHIRHVLLQVYFVVFEAGS